MVTQYDEIEGQRRQLGPLMPASRVTLESFSSLVDTFTQECVTMIKETYQHWQIKVMEQIKEMQARWKRISLKKQKNSLNKRFMR